MVKKVWPKLIFVLGGAASGKSRFAETFVEAQARPRIYLATAQAFDTEMEEKIALHRDRRLPGWTTIEAPMDAAARLRALPGEAMVLFDCATLWMSNQLLADADLDAAQGDLLAALADCAAPVVLVSNEVGQGIVPDNALARRFREAQGRLNIVLAAQADVVVHVVAGLPQVLTGRLT